MDSQLLSLAETQKILVITNYARRMNINLKKSTMKTHEKQIVDGINLNDNIEILAKRIGTYCPSEGRLAEFDFLETSPDLDISDYSDESTAGSDMRIINHSFNSPWNFADLDIWFIVMIRWPEAKWDLLIIRLNSKHIQMII